MTLGIMLQVIMRHYSLNTLLIETLFIIVLTSSATPKLLKAIVFPAFTFSKFQTCFSQFLVHSENFLIFRGAFY